MWSALAPMTWQIGFVQSRLEVVRDHFYAFLERAEGNVKIEYPQGDLSKALGSLPPLYLGDRASILLSSTQLAGWTAVFSADAHGDGVDDLIPFRVMEIGVRGYCFGSNFGFHNPSCLAALSFRVFGPEATLGEVRSVHVYEEDRGRWKFYAQGDPLPFENVEGHSKRRKIERLNPEILEDYALALGFRLHDPDFYTSPRCILRMPCKYGLKFTLPEARAPLGLE